MKNKLKEITTISVSMADKKLVRKYALEYDCKQYQLIGALLKIIKQYKPELKDLLNGGKK